MPAMSRTYFKETNAILTNPGMGFKTFQRFNGDLNNGGTGWTEGFPIEYQPDRGTLVTPEHPMCSLMYFRIYWRFLEPEQGQYQWDMVDKVLATAKARGQTIYLRVAPYGNPGGEISNDLPDWFREAYPEEYTGEHTYWRVDHEARPFISHFGRFVSALAERYNGHPSLECVDISIIGFWGEGEGTDVISQAAREALLEPYLFGFKDTLLVLQLTDPATVKYCADNHPHVGWRVDCLGDMRGISTPGRWCHMLDLYPVDVIRCGAEDLWKTGPVSLECCWVMQHWLNEGWDIDYIIEQSLRWHINNYNSKSSRVPPEWQSQVDDWLRRMGYRFVPRKFAHSENATPGGELVYDSWWSNMGVSPTYRPHPLALRLVGDNGYTTILKLPYDMRSLLPGDAIIKGSIDLPGDIPVGNYQVQLAVLSCYEDAPQVQLAVQGVAADGWLDCAVLRIEPVI